MGLVKGQDVILSTYQFDGTADVFVPIACARSVSFDVSTDFIETSKINSNGFKTFLPSGKQYTGNLEGLVFLNKPATGIEVKATARYNNYGNVNSRFPNIQSNNDIYVNDPIFGFILLSSLSGSFSNYESYIDAIIEDFNTNTYGYLANKIIISSVIYINFTARPGLGSTINGYNMAVSFIVDGIALPAFLTPFEGGSGGYLPDKLGIGWMYDRINSGERFFLKYYETDSDNHFLQKECYVYIDSLNETASFDNMTTFTASFKGDDQTIITYGEI